MIKKKSLQSENLEKEWKRGNLMNTDTAFFQKKHSITGKDGLKAVNFQMN